MDSDAQPTILHLLEPGGGGAMRHVLDLAQQQAQEGAQVHLVCSRERLEPLFAPQLRSLRGAALHELPMRRAPHISDISNLHQLINILREVKPDILHAHSTKAGMLARLARLFVKVKVIYTPHALMTLDPETSAIKKFCYGIYERLLAPLTHRMIVLSSFEYDHALDLGITPARLVMGLNGIAALPSANREEIRRQLGATADDVIIGFVGRLARQKNPELAIQSFAAALEDNSILKLVIIGEGELRSACEKLAAELQVTDRIIWLGAVDAKYFYAGMDILLITSRYEGMAYTFIEALHAGIPVISTVVGGSDSCVIPGQTGILVQRDAGDIARAILQLANDEPMRDAMRFSARAHARHFSLAEMNRVHWRIYAD